MHYGMMNLLGIT